MNFTATNLTKPQTPAWRRALGVCANRGESKQFNQFDCSIDFSYISILESHLTPLVGGNNLNQEASR